MSKTYHKITVTHRQEREKAIVKIERVTHTNIPRAKEISIPRSLGESIALDIIARCRDIEPTAKISIAGSIRRKKETIHDIDILISPPSQAIHNYIETLGAILINGPSKMSILYDIHQEAPVQIDFRFISPVSWGPAIQYFTGSAEHNISLRRIAQEQNLTLNEHGLFTSGGTRLDDGTEGGIYQALGLRWLPPEYRNGFIGRSTPYEPKPTWCIDHQVKDFCKRNRAISSHRSWERPPTEGTVGATSR